MPVLDRPALDKIRSASKDEPKAVCQVRNPTGTIRWIIFHADRDPEILWCIAALGSQKPEFGTVSVRNLDALVDLDRLRLSVDWEFEGAGKPPEHFLG